MMLGKTSLKMVSQEVVQTEFSVVHGLTRMHGLTRLTRNEDTVSVMPILIVEIATKSGFCAYACARCAFLV